MKVSNLIKLLQDWEKKYGSNAQISVPRSRYQRGAAYQSGINNPEFGKEIFIQESPISTYLDSRGLEVEW